MSESPHQSFETATKKGAGESSDSPVRKTGGGVLEFLVILVISFALVFGVVRPYVVEAFYIPSESMVPTLEIGDRVLANKFIYRFTDPERGEVVVFKSVEGGELPPERNPIVSFVDFLRGKQGPPPREDLIKRIVGLPGDEVVVKEGTVLVNGEPQEEPFVNGKFPDLSTSAPITVPKDHVFVMGDNRANSRDSRVFGPVPYENIEGQAFVRFWPLDRLGLL